ncbi:Cj0814 family flagellar-dependent secreted protein [uncultured Campylobacter sp.]|uniref:Cj0814 family flagellar-dependent secreted protein n=1 Tax=uncultured Campylobacter sp. TaxID=218934 RepID=UPI00262CBB0D|nr:hypothetical protein [uncultured Campylobacter sp.]
MLYFVSNTSTLYSPNLENKNIKNQTSSLNTNLNQTIVKDKSQAVSEILGYGVDSEGFFTSDFNEAAGLPKDFRIEYKSVESIINTYKQSGLFVSIDIAKSMQNAYKVFSALVDDKNVNYFTKNDIANLPLAFTYDKTTFNINKLHYNQNEYDEALNLETNLKIYQNPTYTSLLFSSPETNLNYKNNIVSKAEVFMAFLEDKSFLIEGEVSILGKLNGYDKNMNLDDIENLNNFVFKENSGFILKGGGDSIDDLLKKSLEFYDLLKKHTNIDEFKKATEIWLKENTLEQNHTHSTNNPNNNNPTPKDKKPFTPIQAESKNETYTYDDIAKNFFLTFLENERKKGADILELLEKLFKVDKSKIDLKV